MADFIKNIKDAKNLIDKNHGKPISAYKIVNLESLKLRGYVKTGNSNDGDVAWLTNKGLIALEDNEG